MNIRTVKVTGIKWFTDSFGQIKPVLTLDKMIKAKDTSFDGIAFEDVSKIREGKICYNQNIKVRITPSNVKLTNMKVKQGNLGSPISPVIESCPVCKAQVIEPVSFKYVCSNDFCSAKAKAQLLKFGKEVMPDYDIDTIKSYFDTFKETQSDEPTVIGSFHHYVFIVDNALVKTYDTTARVGCLDEKHVDLENALVKALVNGLSNKQFWSILNLRSVKEEHLEQLSLVDYKLIAQDQKAFDAQLYKQFGNNPENVVLVRDILLTANALPRTLQHLDSIQNAERKV